jgi:hypothetical protein
LPAEAALAILGDEFAIEDVIAQAVRAGIDFEDDAATTATIASVGTAFGTELATVKMHGPVATFTGAGINFDLIDKHELGEDVAPKRGRAMAKVQ